MNSPQFSVSSKVLVSDFDGTMTQFDFYKLVIKSLLPPDTPDYWAEYRAGKITHFEALRRYFASIQASEDEVIAVVREMKLDDGLPAAVQFLRKAGWDIVVTSAGCSWYINRLLNDFGVSVEVLSNPGRFQNGEGLIMEMPRNSPFFSPELGINKTGVVEHFLTEGRTVAFAGDGFPDAEPARIVPEDLRFARGDLANVLQREGLHYHRFEAWSEIAKTLLNR
ncbi:2-hydroxy-3-keto-5-methylthiopentenyl-1-phosphate phosphatase [Pirellula sp. SH-Sr6A]|uniref:MtnX-like HAD-IB family phosphatase n=1 Tax=Pirellula sp. SH-Sr6A TaxID=1632865 RepID=UPI00078DF706|nr:MtnX-like HAD-IB family phosphatase [Pirellula sp. SH-Sr6A]AMV32454.1 2-hydroxy-3-keto-5-methylthiopentenyl-1-phosphate phosphatase [Pirellula sp. SH-Sr6A]